VRAVKIAHVANFYGPRSGGLRTAMHALGRGYLEAGHDVVLIVPGEHDAVEDTPFGRRVSVAAPEIPRLGGYRVITDPGRVVHLLEREAPDRLEVSDRLTLRGLGWWARACGVRSVVWSHEHLFGVLRRFVPPIVPRQKIADALNRNSASAYDTVVCTTQFALQEFLRVRASNVVQVPLGVDLDMFRPSLRSRQLRDDLTRGARTLLVHCSRLSPEKEPGRAVEPLRGLVNAHGLDARLVVIGDGPERPSLQREAADLPVDFLGFESDRARVAQTLAVADVVIAPGPLETFGLAALEALGCGTPVVVSASGALAEIVVGDEGAVVEDTPAAFAAGVLDVLQVPEAVRRSAARARAEQFPWANAVRQMLSLHAGGGLADRPAA